MKKQENKNMIAVDKEGRLIPNPCVKCFEPARYGKNGSWFCLEHWIESELWKEQQN